MANPAVLKEMLKPGFEPWLMESDSPAFYHQTYSLNESRLFLSNGPVALQGHFSRVDPRWRIRLFTHRHNGVVVVA